MNDETSGCRNKNKLPLHYVGQTPCIRRRRGNHNKCRKTALVCCVRLYLSCIRQRSSTLWTIATSGASELKPQETSDAGWVENMFSCSRLSRGNDGSVQVLQARASKTSQEQSCWRPSVFQCLRMFCLCLMGTMCCDSSWCVSGGFCDTQIISITGFNWLLLNKCFPLA